MFEVLRKLTLANLRMRLKTRLSVAARDSNECLRTGIGFVCWNQVPGDYLEFGCYSGKSFCYAYDLFRSERRTVASTLTPEDRIVFEREMPRFFAFDSFEGLPDCRKTDQHPYFPKSWKKLKFAMSQREFERILSQRGVKAKDVCIVPGWYDKTLTRATKSRFDLRRASVVNIDCDLYESAMLALNFITDLVTDGTVIIFDDYNFFRGSSELGERRAFSEWLTANPAIKATELSRHYFDKVAFFLAVKE